jgi:capsular exopolysaccharide synthesis family protein
MKKSQKKNRTSAAKIQMNDQLKFQITESFKAIRTNIMFSLLTDGCKKIVVSSSLAGEGKTTTAVHTAISLAEMETRVLLIDADLRKPKVHQFFHLKNTPGLTNYFGNMTPLENILQRTDYKNLSVICSGVSVPNPSELLASEKMAELLRELETRFDYIVIDTPPLNVVVDAVPLIKLCNGVILVVRQGSSTYPELNKTVKNLEMINAKILGIILNGMAAKPKGGYRYGYQKYGYGDYSTYGY